MTSNSPIPLPAPEPDCASFADLLPLLGEDILDENTHKRLRQHVATCAYCQAQVAVDTRIAGVFRRYFEPPITRPFSQEELMRITDNDPRPQAARQATPAPSPLTPMRQRGLLPGRVKTITAVAAIAAVVVLFVVLFQGFGLGRPHSNTGAPTNTKPTPTSRQVPDSILFGVPVIAPSNPQVIYQLGATNASSTQVLLQRSTDGGASWHSFSLPAQSAGPEPGIFVSPLDAQTIFVSLGGTLANNTCAPRQGVGSYSARSGGDYACVLQYRSQDGGAHWTRLSLPSNDVLGDFRAATSHATIASIHALQAQGTRLYAALIPSIPSYLSGSTGSTAPRLVTSDDGGLTWQIADHGLPLTANNTLCDAVAAPTGSLIFAIVGKGCPGVATSVSLWRSDDAGAHWSKAAQLPDTFEYGMAVVENGNAALPLLYINTGRTCLPSNALLASRPNGGSCGGAPTELRVSADGGKTWQNAPTQGYPDQNQNPDRPQGVLSDGSVLFLVKNHFYTWKAGAAAWQSVGPAVSDGVQYTLVTATASDQQTLWVVSLQNSGSFAIKSYQI